MKGAVKIKEVKIVKSGIFYNVYGDDAFILNYLLNFKVRIANKTGFPEKSLEKVINTLEDNRVNYIVYENNLVTNKNTFSKNNYNKILKKAKINYLKNEELNTIIDKLKNLDESKTKELIELINNELKD